MKVLFHVPAHIDAVDIHHELTTRLATSLSEKEETSLAEYDIIHFFGCWSSAACTLAKKAYAAKVPYVLTPLGSLQPWEMKHHQKTLLFQRQKVMAERAAAVHVCGKLERETCETLGWNKRISLIKNPVLTSLATFDDTISDIRALYRKVLDSNSRLLMRQDEQQLVGQLLHLGIDDRAYADTALTDSVCQAASQLTDEAWRRILIYIVDENVSAPVKDALQRLHIAYPQTDVGAIPRFDNASPYPPDHLKDDALISRSILLRNKAKDAFGNQGKKEQRICTALLNLQYEMNHHQAPLQHLADLYRILRFNDCDEDNVKVMTRELGIADMAARTMAVLQQLLGLTEGFMPVEPKDDRKTREMMVQISKFGTYKNNQ